MIYQINDNTIIDIKYNSNDIVIQFQLDEKIYQDVFLLSSIKDDNNYFDTMNIIEKFINNCLNKKSTFKYNYSISKTINLTFSYLNELKDINLNFELLPIRQDISNNKQIIELKKNVFKLKSIIEKYPFLNNYYYNENLFEPINIKLNNIIISNMEQYEVSPLYGFKGMITGYFELFNVLDNKLNNSNYNQNHGVVNKFYPNGFHNGQYNYNDIIKIRNYKVLDNNKTFIDDKFKELNINKLILFDVNIFNQLRHLPNSLYELIIIKCEFYNFDKLKIHLDEIHLYDCTIKNINMLKEKVNKIHLYNCNINSITESEFSNITKH